MNAIRFWIVLILGTAVIGGGLMYYQLVYAGYAELDGAEVGEIQLVSEETGELVPLMLENVKGIDTVVDGVRLSGAISFRACFEISVPMPELTRTFVMSDVATPLTAPSWFDCFDAREIGTALENSTAVAFDSVSNITYGVDRVVAIMDDGRGFVWHQLNACGDALFSGDTPPQDCPPVPEDF